MSGKSGALIGVLFAVSAAAGGGLGGCAAQGAYTAQSEAARDPQRAQELTLRAAALIEGRPDQAENMLREALGADLYHGPAHNNLGVVLLKRGMLYEAAGEFEWAKKLLPGHPDPRMNLALTLEKAGRYDEAIGSYSDAIAVYPEHLPSIQALARLQVRAGKTDDRTRERLEMIAMRGDEPWREWARAQSARMER